MWYPQEMVLWHVCCWVWTSSGTQIKPPSHIQPVEEKHLMKYCATKPDKHSSGNAPNVTCSDTWSSRIHNLFVELSNQWKCESVRTSMRNFGLSGMNSLKISADDRLGTEQRTTKRRQLWKSNQPQWAFKDVLGITSHATPASQTHVRCN